MSLSDCLLGLSEVAGAVEGAGFELNQFDIDSVVGDHGGVGSTLVVDVPAFEAVDHDAVEIRPQEMSITESGALQLELCVRIDDESETHQSPVGAEGQASTVTAAASTGQPGTNAGAVSRAGTGSSTDPGPNVSSTDDTSIESQTTGRSSVEEKATALEVSRESALCRAEPADDADGRPRSAHHGDGDDAVDDAVDDRERVAPDDQDEDVANDRDEEATDDGEPAHRDPDQLRAVYDEDLTFAEMRDALGVEVTPQTVRKHMVKHGIHEPNTHSITRGSGSIDPDSDTADDDGDSLEIDRTASDGDDTDSNADAPDSPTGRPASSVDDPDSSAEESASDEDESASSADESSDAEEDSPKNADESPRQDPDGDAESAPASPEADEHDGDSPTEESAGPTDGPADSSGADPEQQAIPDGIGIQDHLDVETVVEAVTTKHTLYGIQRVLDLDRDETRQLLEDLNLLELVQCRLSKRESPTVAEVEKRIRAADRP